MAPGELDPVILLAAPLVRHRQVFAESGIPKANTQVLTQVYLDTLSVWGMPYLELSSDQIAGEQRRQSTSRRSDPGLGVWIGPHWAAPMQVSVTLLQLPVNRLPGR